jgi:hypothetical protein
MVPTRRRPASAPYGLHPSFSTPIASLDQPTSTRPCRYVGFPPVYRRNWTEILSNSVYHTTPATFPVRSFLFPPSFANYPPFFSLWDAPLISFLFFSSYRKLWSYHRSVGRIRAVSLNSSFGTYLRGYPVLIVTFNFHATLLRLSTT